MAYVAPKSSIYLIKGCPCDRSYNNTIYFESKTDQWMYFRNLVTHTFTNQYYQRYNRGYLRIQANAEDLYEVNYMVFSNQITLTPMSAPTDDVKIFYCFVDNIEYINESVTEIHYTIDVMQTYMFDYTLGECFVEREHTLTDGLGEHRAPEPFEGDDYYYTILYQLNPDINTSATEPISQYYLAIRYVPNNEYIAYWEFDQTLVSSQSTGLYIDYHWSMVGYDPINMYNEPKGELRNGTYTGAKTVFIPLFNDKYPTTNPIDYNNIERVLSQMVQKSCTIVEILLLPNYMVNLSKNLIPPANNFDDWDTFSTDRLISLTRDNTTFEDNHHIIYTPSNKKLLQFPYDYLYVTSNEGNEMEYSWEDFGWRTSNNKQQIRFNLYGSITGTPELSLVPIQYDGWADYNYTKRISLNNFPSVAWAEDSFARMWSENKTKITNGLIQASIAAIGSAFKGAAMGIAGNMLGGAVGGALGSAIGSYGSGLLNKGVLPNSDMRRSILEGVDIIGAKQQANFDQNTKQGAASGAILSHAVASLIDCYHKRDTLNGSQSGSQIPILMNKYGFTIFRKCIKPYYAKMIDDYFTLYGYAIKEHKVPNIKSADPTELRPHWNYIKNELTVVLPVIDEHLKRYLSCDVEEQIQTIYNKGITFWMHGEEVGDYSLDNSPQI